MDKTSQRLWLFGCLIAFGVFATFLPNDVRAAQPKEAQVTHVIRDVRLVPTNAAPRPASVNDQVREGTVVRTAGDSRAELTFTDQIVARLGANTVFGLGEGGRIFDLSSGAILVQAPKNAGGAKVKIGAVTAVVTSTTTLLEYNPTGYIKLIVLEGTGRMYLNQWGESVLIRAGQMLILNPNAKQVPDAVDIDLGRLLKTCRLITEFPALPKQALITRAVNDQGAQKSNGAFIDTNLVIFGRGTLVNLVDPATANPSPSPNPAISPPE